MIKKYQSTLYLLLLLLLGQTQWSCKGTGKAKQAAQETLEFSCQLKSCDLGETLNLYTFNGINFTEIQTAMADSVGLYKFTIPKSTEKFYYVGPHSQNIKPILLGQEKGITVVGNCKEMRAAKAMNSPLNANFQETMKKVNALQTENNQLFKEFRQAMGNPASLKLVEEKLANLDQRKLDLLETTKATSLTVARIVATKTYLSFQNNQGAYENEIDYYAKASFRFIDFKDSGYNNIPAVYELYRDVARTLMGVNTTTEQLKIYLDSALSQIPVNTNMQRYALGGVVHALQAKNHELFPEYGTRYLAVAEDMEEAPIVDLKMKLQNATAFIIGAAPPDFTQQTPEGTPMSLSDFKGKIVLLDFWASWCGPCRRENPNVLRLYEKYNKKGFEVLAVSLDQKKAAWVKAIEKDGLVWNHVSDLKGWKNEVAGTYSVRSIPQTFLLDQEGKILAKNLRGPSLESELAKIFGE